MSAVYALCEGCGYAQPVDSSCRDCGAPALLDRIRPVATARVIPFPVGDALKQAVAARKRPAEQDDGRV